MLIGGGVAAVIWSSGLIRGAVVIAADNMAYATVGVETVVEAGRLASSAAGCTPRWAHVYLFKDRDFVLWMVRQAEKMKFDAIVVTCDHAHERVRDMTMPAFEAGCDGPARADGTGQTVREIMRFPNVEAYRAARALSGLSEPSDRVGQNDESLTWADVRWLCDQTTLPVVCKGVLRAVDAQLAVQHGARGLVVSNHGGRQMDGAVPAITALPEVRSTDKHAAQLTSTPRPN
jgi:isopentenyl diphosphate isomerase/L-lactate dehydrogenase-like FMN-dependent dehydrogenase